MIALWRGRLPLSRAFWEYAVLYGAIASMAATTASLAALTAGLPGAAAVALHLLPTPYLAVAVTGVWRSADAYRGSPFWAQSARVAVVLWAGLMVIV